MVCKRKLQTQPITRDEETKQKARDHGKPLSPQNSVNLKLK